MKDRVVRDDGSKPCRTCGATKLRTEFNVNRNSKDGRDYSCRSCTIKKSKELYHKSGGRKIEEKAFTLRFEKAMRDWDPSTEDPNIKMLPVWGFKSSSRCTKDLEIKNYTLVSAEDYDKFKEFLLTCYGNYASINLTSFNKGRGKFSPECTKKAYRLHEMLYGVDTENGFLPYHTSKDYVVDHIDGDPLNNVRTNLRKCSNKQNAINKFSTPIHVKMKYGAPYYCAEIYRNNRSCHIVSSRDASLIPLMSLIRRAVALQVQGPFYRIDEPQEDDAMWLEKYKEDLTDLEIKEIISQVRSYYNWGE